MRPVGGNGNIGSSSNYTQPLQHQQQRLISSSSYSLFDPVPPPLPPVTATLNGIAAGSGHQQATSTSTSTSTSGPTVGSFGSLGLAFGHPLASAPYFDRNLYIVGTPVSPSSASPYPTASTPLSSLSRATSPTTSDDNMSSSGGVNGSRKRTRDTPTMTTSIPSDASSNNNTNYGDNDGSNGNGVHDERKRKISNVGESPINGEITMAAEPLSTTAATAAANAAWSHAAPLPAATANNSDSLFAMPYGATPRKLGPAAPLPSTSSSSSSSLLSLSSGSSESKARSDDPVFAQLSHSSGRSNLNLHQHMRSISTLSTTTPYSVDGLRINPTPTPRGGINEDNEVDADVVITAATAINEEEMKYSDEGAANMVAPPTQALIAAGLIPVTSSTGGSSSGGVGGGIPLSTSSSTGLPFEFQKSQSQGGSTPISRVLSSTSTNTGATPLPPGPPSPTRSSTLSSTPGLSHASSNQSSAQTPVTSKHSISFTTFELNGKYKVLEYLGSGSYGHVHLAENEAGDKVAIKKIPAIFDNLVNAKRLLREIRILRQLNHPTVIGFR
jgi:hypothetical protein